MKSKFAFPFLSAILVTVLSCKDPERKKTNFPNTLKNTHWIIEAGGLIKPDGAKDYYLSKRIDSAFILNFHAIDFLDAENFKSYDSWECGNDCFTEVHGKYYFTETNRIDMEVDSITHWGTCDEPKQIFKPVKEMSFNIAKDGKQLRLVRNK